MTSVLAIYSKALYEERARSAAGALLGLGELFATDTYTSTHKGLSPLASGGRLYIVTVRPPETLWLIAVLEAPRLVPERGWVAQPNVRPITDVDALRPQLRFANGKGLPKDKGKLGMSLQTPRVLTAADEALLESVFAAAGQPASAAVAAAPRAVPPPPARFAFPTLEAATELAARGEAWRALDGSQLVLVPAGAFVAGLRQRRHEELPAFAAAVHPITNAQWARFIEQTGYSPPADHPEPERYLAHWSRKAPPAQLLEHPVVNVSAIDAGHYCAWAQLALPTGLEWEKAARGVDGRSYPWGEHTPVYSRWDAGTKKSEHVRLCHVRAEQTAAVGSYAQVRTAWGCQDMVGNVSEMCVADAGRDPRTLRAEDRVQLRGSAFLRVNPGVRMYCAYERTLRATGRNRWQGFRVVYRFAPLASAGTRPG